MADKQATTQRDGFKSKWGFILACIGSAVGMGNIWRFPIMVSLWGGMTFLIPYFICVILIGSTGVIGEFALGRATGAGPIGAFGKCTELRGNRKIGEAIGFIPVLGSMALAIGYTVVMGWIFKYTAIAITGDMHAMGQDMAAIGGHFDIVAISNLPWIIVAIVASFAIMAMGVSGGIEKANKVMMPVLFFLFVGLGIYIAFLPGASAGYKYIFTLDPKGLANPMVWIFAFGQAFFSLSVAGNGSVIYGSYLPKNENLPGSARNVAIFDTLAALLAAFVIIPAMAAGGAPLEKGGPGLMFVWLVNVLNGMPGGRIIGVIFFVCVLFAGLSSIINLYEAPVATLQDNLKLKRVPATAIILVIGCVIAILIQKITSEWMDVVSIYICPLGALLAGIMFFWVAGKKFVLDEVNDGLQKPIGGWFYPLAKYVYCILCIVALVAGAALGGIGAVSLLVAAIGIANTMMMSIYERTKEIGVLKVLGCSLATIRNMFLIEAGFIGFMGGLIGLALSFMVSVLINQFLAATFLYGMDGKLSVIPIWLAVPSVGFAIIIGMAAGFFPAMRAMKLSPLAAIRNE